MKASLSWLKEYVQIEMDANEISKAITMAGLEVDSLTDRFQYLNDCIVGRITDIKPHPKADKLTCCTVDIGNRNVNVVCGAPNVKVGMCSVLALPGTIMPDGKEIEETVLRGETSCGMLCSEGELGLGSDRSGIMEIDDSQSIGKPVNTVLGLYDSLFEVDLTPNRPDCLSIIGIAREIAAIEKRKLNYPDYHIQDNQNDIADLSSVDIQAPDDCPRYAARIIDGVKIEASPFWLQDRLLSIGLRPINNIVDVTNYVMMETGQPLHAFDLDHLAEQRIVVRTASPGEKFTTLDDKQRVLESDMLMICDGQKPVAIAGVMGGANSEIAPETTRVLIESAYFNPASVRKTSKKLGLNTDASHRFERGVDPEGTINALNRAAKLMAQITGGKVVSGLIDEHPQKIKNAAIDLDVEHTNWYLGLKLTADQMASCLKAIEFDVQVKSKSLLTVAAPSFRVDVTRPVDLMEEVARIYGYNNIPTTFPAIPGKVRPVRKILSVRQNIKNRMIGLGFTEIVSYSFMGEQAFDQLRFPDDDRRRKMVRILNPLTEDHAGMRTSLIPGLLMALQRNLSQQTRDLKIFEIGKTFIDQGQKVLPEETQMIAGLQTGSRYPRSWLHKDQECDFYDLKGAVEYLFESQDISGVAFTATPVDKCYYTRSGFSADIVLGDQSIGRIGQLHPKVLDAYNIHQSAFIFELDLDRIIPVIPDYKVAGTISRFPAVLRDLTMIIDKQVESADILNGIKEINETLVESCSIFDVFDGDPIPDGRKSISIRIVYRSMTETLEDERVNEIHQRISRQVIEQNNATLPP